MPSSPERENIVTVGRCLFRCVSHLSAATFLLLVTPLHAQQIASLGQPIAPAAADPAIAGALQQVSPDHIRATIEKLVSFNNRNTLSSMDTDLAPNTGVSAAANWIESEFKRISADCGGCLEVRRDDFIEPPQSGPSSRILKPTKITNVYAILRGTDPAQAAKLFSTESGLGTPDSTVVGSQLTSLASVAVNLPLFVLAAAGIIFWLYKATKGHPFAKEAAFFLFLFA